MNNNFFFYVCDDEFDRFKRDDEDKTINIRNSDEQVRYKYREELDEDNHRNVYVIVVDGASMVSKENTHKNFKLAPNELAKFITKYFEELEEIAQDVFEEMGEEWSPERVTVLTHWGGEPVDDKEEAFSRAVATFTNENRFRMWRIVSSSSTRQEAFPKGFNPFVTTGNAANLPTATVCEILERNLPFAGKIDWVDAAKTTDEAELKRYYDRLMLKLNH